MKTRMWMFTVGLFSACATPTSAPSAAEVEVYSQQALSLESAAASCATIRCREGYVCEEGRFGARCVPAPTPPGACRADEDCRLEANYCTGCDCVALADGEVLPKCPGTPVQCLVDPCRQSEAQCQDGQCVVVNGGGSLQ